MTKDFWFVLNETAFLYGPATYYGGDHLFSPRGVQGGKTRVSECTRPYSSTPL